jgi:predicted nucleotidyltransferase
MVDQGAIDTVKQYVMTIPKTFGLNCIFGSCARGLETEDSDIDIALILQNMPDFFHTQKQLMKLRRNIDLRIEPHPIREQDFNSLNPLAHEIEKSGVEITVDK